MRKIIAILFSVCYLLAHAEYPSFVSVGDIIEINGHKAIVFQTDDGIHGTAMSVKALRGIDSPWCNNGKIAKKIPPISDTKDGFSNTLQLIQFAKSQNCLHNFPAFQWCQKLGEGWYIPSVKELESFINYWLGNEEVLDWDDEVEQEIDPSKPFYKNVNEMLLNAGGTPFINGVYTSTVNADGKVYIFNYDRNKNTWSFKLKSKTNLGQDCVGRAFIKF